MRNGIIENQSLFYTREKSRFLYCGVHVDDIVTVSSDNEFEKVYERNKTVHRHEGFRRN